VKATPHDGEEWVRQVNRRLSLIERHRHPNAQTGTPDPPESSLDTSWHYVGMAGEPTLNPALENYVRSTLDWSPVRFCMDGSGNVWVEGLVMVNVATPNVTLFTLPPAYRPSVRQVFWVSYQDGSNAPIEVLTTGEVRIFGGTIPAGNYISLGFDFPTKVTWTPLALVSGWTGYQTDINGVPSFGIDSAGDMHFQGIITGGAIGPTAFTLPVGARPADTKMFLPVATTGQARMDMRPDGTVVVIGGTPGADLSWLTLSGWKVPNVPGGAWFWTPIPTNGWVRFENIPGGWPPLQLVRNVNGVCSMQGLIKDGGTGVPTEILQPGRIPPAYRSGHGRIKVSNAAGPGFDGCSCRTDIYQDGALAFGGFQWSGTNGFIWIDQRWIAQT
jgi:hypothetical protein